MNGTLIHTLQERTTITVKKLNKKAFVKKIVEVKNFLKELRQNLVGGIFGFLRLLLQARLDRSFKSLLLE